MDIKTAIDLIESGRYAEIDIEDLWEIIEILSASTEPAAIQALLKLQNSRIGQSLPQLNLQMQYIIEKNSLALEKMEQSLNLFTLDKHGKPQHKSLWPIFNFYANIEVENKTENETVKKECLFEQAVEIAKLNIKKDMLLNKNFAKQSEEEQKKNYTSDLLMSMEEMAFVLVSNQIVENAVEKKQAPLSKKDKLNIEKEAETLFHKIITGKAKGNVKLSNSNIIATFAATINNASNKADLVEKNCGSKELIKLVSETDGLFAGEYPQTFSLLRPLSPYQSMAFVAGKSGRHLYAAKTLAENIHQNNPAKAQKELSLFEFLQHQPEKLKIFSQNIVQSIKKIYQFLTDVLSYSLSSEKIAKNLKLMFSFFRSRGKNINKKIDNKMRIMSADASRLVKLTDNERVIAWKNFRDTYGRSLENGMLDPQKTELTTDDAESYVTVTNIKIKKKKVSPLKKIWQAFSLKRSAKDR